MKYPENIVGEPFFHVREGDPWDCCHVLVLARIGQEVRCRLTTRRWLRVAQEPRFRQRVLRWADLA